MSRTAPIEFAKEPRSKLWLAGFLVFASLPALSSIGAMPDAWYAGLVKAPWNPPNWVFGPAWSILYVLIGVSGWLAFRAGAPASVFRGYLTQWVLNALWTPVFFAAHRPGLALVVILAMVIAIVWTMRQFNSWSSTAAWLLAPYLAWVLFATSLNGYIAWAN